jgi:hypothetical protein
MNSTNTTHSTGNFSTCLDREARDSFDIRVYAIDTESGSRDIAVVHIDVLDANDLLPYFDENQQFEVDEGDGDALVGTVTAKDDDLGDNAVIAYELTPVGIPFTVNASTGEIRTTSALDREEKDKHTFTIRAFNPNFKSSARVDHDITVIVKDVNDETPQFEPSDTIALDVNETLGIGTIVLKLEFKDADQPNTRNAEADFKITGGNDAEKWDLSKDGALQLINALDGDNNETEYRLQIQVTDRGVTGNGSLSSDGLIAISVIDENDNRPKFMKSLYSRTVPEDTSPGQKLVVIRAVEKDQDKDITYTISIGDESMFSLGEENGTLTLIGDFDYEKSRATLCW